MPQATVGRRIYYHPLREELSSDHAQPFDAGIAHVNTNGTINISITNDLGNPQHGKQNVVLRDTYEETNPGEAGWMPYQVQAEKEKPSPLETPVG